MKCFEFKNIAEAKIKILSLDDTRARIVPMM
jgi:hypothetical protein